MAFAPSRFTSLRFRWRGCLGSKLVPLPLGFALSVILVLAASLANAADQVTLAWDPNPEPDVIGYRLHYGTTSGHYQQTINVGDTTIFTLSGLSVGTQYYAVVTAYNAAGLESPPSNEVAFETKPADSLPTIRFESPEGGSVHLAPATMVLYATAGTYDGKVQRVEFFDDATRLGEAALKPWSYIWRQVAAGEHTLTAVVWFTDGTSRASAPLTVHVSERTEDDPAQFESEVSTLVPIPIQLTSGGSEDDSFLIFVSGHEGENVEVQSSPDLLHWSSLGTLKIHGGYSYFIDSEAIRRATRLYYRVIRD